MAVNMKGKRIIGVLQAGGESRRFGSPKAFALFKGKPLYQRGIDALHPNVDDLYIVSHPNLTLKFKPSTPCHIIEDFPIYQGYGPLAGLYRVMQETEAEWYMQLACDLPQMTAHAIRQLIDQLALQLEGIDALVPSALGYRQPLCAFYHRRCLHEIESLLKSKQLKMGFLLQRVQSKIIDAETVGLSPSCFININRQSELQDLNSKHCVD